MKLYMHLLLECYSSLKGMFNAPRQTFQLNFYYYCYNNVIDIIMNMNTT